MQKPPMICKTCSRQWDIEPDEVRCDCGQQLFRVMIGPDGQLYGPPSMPEHIRAQMQQAWEQNRHLFTQTETRRAWNEAQRVEPETPFVLQPDQVAKDAVAAFGRESEAARHDEFYASWSAYDEAIAAMPPRQQALQRKAEILALEQMTR